MQSRDDLYLQLCSYQNLELAFRKARKRKTKKKYVLEFEKKLNNNLSHLQNELLSCSYNPRALETFILRDPKTRKINKAHFRDRIVHHALCNVIESFFQKSFIYDSYANQIGKGTIKAIKRFDEFKKKVTKNNTRRGFVLKCDIEKYFDNVDHNVLLSILKKKLFDEKILWLIKIILNNHRTRRKEKAMPLGNLTSQFFANIYLNELDQFVKHTLKERYYIRYVDDFVIFHESKKSLEQCKEKIQSFIGKNLLLNLHPLKSRIIQLKDGVAFLGLKIFFYHKIILRKNKRNFQRKLQEYNIRYKEKEYSYDKIYDFLEGWIAYAKNADTYNLRKRILTQIEIEFKTEIATKDIHRYDRFIKYP